MSNISLKRKLDCPNGNNTVSSRSQVLNDKLSRRPDRHQLVEQGILHDSQCAPSLQHVEHALKRARLADELNNRLLNRPGPLDLIQHNILHIDTKDYANLERAIQGGEILFKTTSVNRRPLIFHEYTGSPASCKPKVTKIESLSSTSNAHQIRLAQQQLLLELTSNKQDEPVLPSLPQKPLEQMTLAELRDLCKQYQIPSSHMNKTKLIERIKQKLQQTIYQNLPTSETNTNELSNIDIISSLQISNADENENIQLLSESELDEILNSYPMDLNNQTTNDEFFLEMLLNSDRSSNETTIDDLFITDLLSSPVSAPSYPTSLSTALPRITSVDEFDAFLSDFTHQILACQQEISTSSS